MSRWLRPWQRKTPEKDEDPIIGMRNEETLLEDSAESKDHLVKVEGEVCHSEALEILEDHFSLPANEEPCEIITNEEIQCVQVIFLFKIFIQIFVYFLLNNLKGIAINLPSGS
jgi:hypothetical protein